MVSVTARNVLLQLSSGYKISFVMKQVRKNQMLWAFYLLLEGKDWSTIIILLVVDLRKGVIGFKQVHLVGIEGMW